MNESLPRVGDVATGTVVRVYPSYAILLFDEGWTGLLHISELSNAYVKHFENFVKLGAIYTVKVIDVESERGAVRVSLKRLSTSEKRRAFRHQEIPPPEVSFSALADRLQGWIDEFNADHPVS